MHLWLPAYTEEETRFIYLVMRPGVLQSTAFSVFKRTQSPTVMCEARPSMWSVGHMSSMGSGLKGESGLGIGGTESWKGLGCGANGRSQYATIKQI